MNIKLRLMLSKILLQAFTITTLALNVALIANMSTLAQEIEISKKSYSPIKIAINSFEVSGIKDYGYAQKIRKIISNDLNSSGLFETIPEESFLEAKCPISNIPFFEVWKRIGSNILLNGAINREPNNDYKIYLRLWDVALGKELMRKSIVFHCNALRRASHIISDSIYFNLTGEPGHFDTKIVYISEDVKNNARFTRMAIMDQDGEDHKYLNNGKFITFSPKISPDNKKVIYVDFRYGVSKIFLRHLYTGEDVLLCNMKGDVFAPRFSNNGKKVLFSVAKRGATNVFTIDLTTKKVQQITKNIYINTSASYSPDDENIIFISDRSGIPHVYIMDNKGNNVKKISSGPFPYSDPIFSPQGNLVCSIKLFQKKFCLSLIDLETKEEEIIAYAPVIHGHCWSPNGRYILFSREAERLSSSKPIYKLYKIDIFGKKITCMPTPYNASDPNWSVSQK